jgi:hypothetical protein
MLIPVPTPSWLLLAWAGGAATSAAVLAGSLLGGRSTMPWALAYRPQSLAQALAGTALAGLLFYPLVYGVLFEVLGTADMRTGAVAGGLHAVVAVGLTFRRRARPALRTLVRVAAARLLYAIVIGFLYVTP